MRLALFFSTAAPLILMLASCSPASTAPVKTSEPVTETADTSEPGRVAYDAVLAEKLGADEYGMRSYVFTILKTGPAEISDAEKRSDLFRGHFANMGRLAEDGKLVMSGPFMDGGDKRGLYIFNVATVEEAQELVKSDPAVEAGIFVAEFTKYYGSAALMQMNAVHETIQKTKIE